jgi:pantothenate kinase
VTDGSQRIPAPLGLDAVADRLLDSLSQGGRTILAVAGPPGAGKSTFCDALHAALERSAPGVAAVLPMDGFHYDNAVIEPLGLLPRKGSPQTFDAHGFVATLRRIRSSDEAVAVPVFDRVMDLARAGARIIAPGQAIVIVEGNYLLLDEDPWTQAAPLFDLTVFLSVPQAVLEERLIRRWLDHGLDLDTAKLRALGNDIPNALHVNANSRAADIVVENF